MTSPICQVKDGSGAYNSTDNGVNVTAGDTITIKLYDTTGVVTWVPTLVGTDEGSTTFVDPTSNGFVLPTATIVSNSLATGFNPSGGSFYIKELGVTISYASYGGNQFTGCTGGTGTLLAGMTIQSVNLVVDNINKLATFTAPQAGSALIFQSQVNGGVDLNGVPQPSYTSTLGIYVETATSLRTGAVGEKTEGSIAFGWITKYNALIRNFTGSAASAGAGLVFSSGAYNVGQNADNTIKVNAHDIQINPAFYSQSSTASTLVERTSGSAINVGQVNATSVVNTGTETVTGLTTLNGGLTLGNATFDWTASIASPTLGQFSTATASATGATMTVAAQSTTGTSSFGGPLILAGGAGTTGSGIVTIKNGSAINTTFGLAAVTLERPSLVFDAGVGSPTIGQVTQTSNVACNTLIINAQAPFATATSTNRTPGFIALQIAAPTNGGTLRGAVFVSDNGNTVAQFGGDASGNGIITIAGAANLSIGTSLVITTSSLALYSGTPVAQAARVGQLTDSTGGTVSTTLAAGITDTNAKNAIASLAAKVNALELALHNIHLTA